ncbi:MAG: hypothetical protein ABH856_00210 [Patescibacteria group bacterium]|nr:hypothetical protein [Patescibacteria group bacterium]
MGTPETNFGKELEIIGSLLEVRLTTQAVVTVRAAFEAILKQDPSLQEDSEVARLRVQLEGREKESQLIERSLFFIEKGDEKPRNLNPKNPEIASIMQLARGKAAVTEGSSPATEETKAEATM